MILVVHGDDFTSLGYEEDLEWFKMKMQSEFQIKHRGRLGSEDEDDKAIRILERIVAWKTWGYPI